MLEWGVSCNFKSGGEAALIKEVVFDLTQRRRGRPPCAGVPEGRAFQAEGPTGAKPLGPACLARSRSSREAPLPNRMHLSTCHSGLRNRHRPRFLSQLHLFGLDQGRLSESRFPHPWNRDNNMHPLHRALGRGRQGSACRCLPPARPAVSPPRCQLWSLLLMLREPHEAPSRPPLMDHRLSGPPAARQHGAPRGQGPRGRERASQEPRCQLLRQQIIPEDKEEWIRVNRRRSPR